MDHLMDHFETMHTCFLTHLPVLIGLSCQSCTVFRFSCLQNPLWLLHIDGLLWPTFLQKWINQLLPVISFKHCEQAAIEVTSKIAADDILFFWLLSFEENKAWFFMAEDSLDTSSLIFSEKQWKNIHECRLLQSWLVLKGLFLFGRFFFVFSLLSTDQLYCSLKF